jgi:hypothetical protein
LKEMCKCKFVFFVSTLQLVASLIIKLEHTASLEVVSLPILMKRNSDGPPETVYFHTPLGCKISQYELHQFCSVQRLSSEMCATAEGFFDDYLVKNFLRHDDLKNHAILQYCDIFALNTLANLNDEQFNSPLILSDGDVKFPLSFTQHFNPTIVVWKGKHLMSLRVVVLGAGESLQIVRLNSSFFDVLNNSELFGTDNKRTVQRRFYRTNNNNTTSTYTSTLSIEDEMLTDVRLFVDENERLFLISNSNHVNKFHSVNGLELPVMMFSELFYDNTDDTFYTIGAPIMLEPPTEIAKRDDNQKNWVPFVNSSTNEILFSFSINPHYVLQFDKSDEFKPQREAVIETHTVTNTETTIMDDNSIVVTNTTTTTSTNTLFSHSPHSMHERLSMDFNISMRLVANTSFDLHTYWLYGEPRGGTQGVLYNSSCYLSVFHSIMNVYTGPGVPFRRYYMGAYLYSAFHPYELLAISTSPIATEHTYNTIMEFPFGKTFFDYCLFPAGLVFSADKSVAYLSYGYQDVQSRIMTLDVRGLIDSLTVIDRRSVEIE